MSETPAAAATHPFQAEVSQVLHLVIHSLYSNKEIFLRELISNASDALDRLRFRALTEADLLKEDPALEIRIHADKDKRTITISDSGVGMTPDEVVKNLGTVAHSGSRAFLEQLAKAKASEAEGGKGGAGPLLIGQFGVGFYSAFLVADHVEVVTHAAGTDGPAVKWTSDGKDGFTVEPVERKERGTQVTLHLKEDQKELLEPYRLQSLVERYSDYLTYPIKIDDKQVNKASALWQRPKAEITDEQYNELYKHLTHDFETPLARTHFRVEGAQEFVGLLYLPKFRPFDFDEGKKRRGVRLFVKRVFIMDDCEETVPSYLRFVRGVVDSDDLPLNVSRELLQDSTALKTIRKQITKKTLDLLDELAKDKSDDYLTFWKSFGTILKEGLAIEAENKERIAELLRYESTGTEAGKVTSLAEYLARMPEKQEEIYYAHGESRKLLEGSPYLEALRARGYEVLLMTDPVDEWAVQTLQEYKSKKLVSAMRGDLQLDASDEEKRETERQGEAIKPLLERAKKILGDQVREVRATARLTDSPCCLVLPPFASSSPYLERLMKERGRGLPPAKRILEVNPHHPLVQRLNTLVAAQGEEPDEGGAAVEGNDRVREWIEVLYDQALLGEGNVPQDPNLFARRIARLLADAVPKA